MSAGGTVEDRRQAPPVVVVSTHERHEVPRVKSAARLAFVAAAADWEVRTGYALAQIAERFRLEDGALIKAAHLLHSVQVSGMRDGRLFRAYWEREGDGDWRNASCRLDGERIGFRELLAVVKVGDG